jgi:hypothetical protein
VLRETTSRSLCGLACPSRTSDRGVKQDPRTHVHKGRGLDLVEDGTRSRGRRGSTLWVFLNKSALRADLRVFESRGCRALGCVVPRGPQKHTSSGPWGASYRRGVKQDPRTHLHKGRGLDLVDDGTRSRGRLKRGRNYRRFVIVFMCVSKRRVGVNFNESPVVESE